MIDELIKAQKEAKDKGETDLDFFTDTHIGQTIGNVLVGGMSNTDPFVRFPVYTSTIITLILNSSQEPAYFHPMFSLVWWFVRKQIKMNAS